MILVTVLILVRENSERLCECIRSIGKYCSGCKVMVLDDLESSSTADFGSLRLLAESLGFEYHRNPARLGIVRTCNHAVFELDNTRNDILILNPAVQVTNGFLEELVSVLNATEKHGIVCPRSNREFFRDCAIFGQLECAELAECTKAYEKINPLLPNYSLVPTVDYGCLLVKRKVISLHGFFDEAYSDMECAVNDFCMRISQYGWSCVMANRAFAFFPGIASGDDASVSSEPYSKDEKLFLGRYPYFKSIVQEYAKKRIHPIDYFSSAISRKSDEKKRVLISLYNLAPKYNGTILFGLQFIKSFIEEFGEKYDISILTRREADAFHKLSKQYKNVVFPETISGVFDIVYVPSQIFHMEHFFVLNRHCLRFVFCMQDIIALRCGHILAANRELEDFFAQSVRYADGIVSISDFTTNDMTAYFPELFEKRRIPVRRIYQASYRMTETVGNGEKLPFDRYFLVFGNAMKHKMLSETVSVLKSCGENLIVFGAEEEGFIAASIYGYKSGSKSDAFINQLLSSCMGIIFPSVYEGFGQVNLYAVDFGKKIIVHDNELNRELFSQFIPEYSENVSFFKKLSDIPGLMRNITESPCIAQKTSVFSPRCTNDVVRETELFLSEIMESPVNSELLSERWNFYNYLEAVFRKNAVEVEKNKSPFVCVIKKYLKKNSFLFNIAKKLWR